MTLPLMDGQTVDLTPEECWGMLARAQQYLAERGHFFELNSRESWRLLGKTRDHLIQRFGETDALRTVQRNNRCFQVTGVTSAGFWNSLEAGRWEPDTLRILDHFLSGERVFIDIGAWIGPTAFYGAQRAGLTLAFEPDPVAFYELESNVRANAHADWASRLRIFNRAIAPQAGNLRIGNLSRGGDSMSSSLFAEAQTSWEVEASTLDEVMATEGLEDQAIFLKVDIEGGEYALLPALAHWLRSPDVVAFVSVHPHFLITRLLPERGNGPLTRVLRRLLLLWHHARFLRAMKFKYLYRSDGRPLRRLPELLALFLRGRFAPEILGTNRRWRQPS